MTLDRAMAGFTLCARGGIAAEVAQLRSVGFTDEVELRAAVQELRGIRKEFWAQRRDKRARKAPYAAKEKAAQRGDMQSAMEGVSLHQRAVVRRRSKLNKDVPYHKNKEHY